MKIIKSVSGLPTNEEDTRKFLKNEFDDKVMEVTLRLSNHCNFKCSYCTYYDNTKKPNDIKFIKRIIDQILIAYKGYENIVYYFHGGEPTIYPHFTELVEYIDYCHKDQNIKYKIEVQTNSSKIKKDFFEKLVNKNIKFICSYQQHQNNINTFKTFIDLCIQYSMLGGIDLILEDFENSDYEEIRKLYFWLEELKRFTNGKYSIQMNTIDGKIVPEIYKDLISNENDKELLLITYKNAENEIIALDKFVSEQRNNFLLFKCDVGLNSIIIDTTNYNQVLVYKCFSDILYSKNKPDYKFSGENINILNEKLTLLIKSHRCMHKKCVCEIQVPKWKK